MPGYGYLQPNDTRGNYNPTAFIVQQLLGRVRTCVMVVVKGLGTTPGTVNVQPLVSMADGNGNGTDHGTIFNVPYLTFQAGTNAIVLVPVVGDVGLAAICDRDSSAAKTTREVGPPPSGREFDFADAVYLFSMLGQTPTQTITFTELAIVVSGNLVINGNLQLAGMIEAADGSGYSGNITTTGNVTAAEVTAGTVALKTHVHSGVTTGGGSSGPPVP